MLRVNEVFSTIQGEAHYTGTPSVFIRLQGCPVGCSWCDTKHTWATNNSSKVPFVDIQAKLDNSPTWAEINSLDLVSYVTKLGPRHFVITGGEPCTYDLTSFTNALSSFGSVQIETSGTHQILASANTWVTISPKINMAGGLAVCADALERANELKMPIANDQDLRNLKQLLAESKFDRPVWLQPVSQDKAATSLCVQNCLHNGWRLSIQTHKFAGVR
jgi:7-carboxy-7-deazaguanine synthase